MEPYYNNPGKWLSLAGRQEKEKLAVLLRRIKTTLQNNGIRSVFEAPAQEYLAFSMNLCCELGYSFSVNYFVSVLLREKKVLLVQQWTDLSDIKLSRTVQWYLEKRNRELRDERMHYRCRQDKEIWIVGPELRFHDCENAIIDTIWRLNETATKDYQIISSLSEGKMDQRMKDLIREEYIDMENEWKAVL